MNKKSMGFLLFGVGFGLLLFSLGVLFGKNQSSQAQGETAKAPTATSKPATPEPVLAVEAIVPTIDEVASAISASGTIVAKDTAQVGAKLSGVAIVEVLVQVGDVVEAGQVLARLDDSVAVQTITAAQADLAGAIANQAKAHADLERVEPLIKIDAISRQQYDAYQTAKAQADAGVVAAKARLNNAQIQAKNSVIVAPISGLVSEKSAQVGLMATGAPLFTIVKNGVLEWQASVSLAKAEQISLGQLVKVQVGEDEIEAVVEKIAPIANNSRELTVHATLKPSPLLRVGMYQSGKFVLPSKQFPALPTRVVTTTDGFSYVWTLKMKDKATATAHRQQVEIVGRMGDKVAVLLDLETLVVKEGGNFLSEGDLVRVVNGTQLKPPSSLQSQPPQALPETPQLTQGGN